MSYKIPQLHISRDEENDDFHLYFGDFYSSHGKERLAKLFPPDQVVFEAGPCEDDSQGVHTLEIMGVVKQAFLAGVEWARKNPDKK